MGLLTEGALLSDFVGGFLSGYWWMRSFSSSPSLPASGVLPSKWHLRLTVDSAMIAGRSASKRTRKYQDYSPVLNAPPPNYKLPCKCSLFLLAGFLFSW